MFNLIYPNVTSTCRQYKHTINALVAFLAHKTGCAVLRQDHHIPGLSGRVDTQAAVWTRRDVPSCPFRPSAWGPPCAVITVRV